MPHKKREVVSLSTFHEISILDLKIKKDNEDDCSVNISVDTWKRQTVALKGSFLAEFYVHDC